MDEEIVDFYWGDEPYRRRPAIDVSVGYAAVSAIESAPSPEFPAIQEIAAEAIRHVELVQNEPPEWTVPAVPLPNRSPVATPIIPDVSDGLRETLQPTPEQEQQFKLEQLYDTAKQVLQDDNPGSIERNTWPSTINGHPARVSTHAYEYWPDDPESLPVYARVAQFGPARKHDPAGEPCIITSLDANEIYNLKTCGPQRNGVILSFHRAFDRLMVTSGPDKNPTYTASDPRDVDFMRTIVEDIAQQSKVTAVLQAIEQHRVKLAKKARIPQPEVYLVPEGIASLALTVDDDVPLVVGSILEGHYYDAAGNELTQTEFFTQPLVFPFLSELLPVVFKAAYSNQEPNGTGRSKRGRGNIWPGSR